MYVQQRTVAGFAGIYIVYTDSEAAKGKFYS